ncbi:hypothetical protein LZ554_002279 [Drepanopeziza brunnea f. sp. 'monogermtubi']|nr:hypothetical protein LZ554_002279 [Drepanopeziza brunnea f. sp. 'monogermtubi']
MSLEAANYWQRSTTLKNFVAIIVLLGFRTTAVRTTAARASAMCTMPAPLGDLGTEIVHIYVGKKRKHFPVHKRLICEKSEYFNAAFTGSFRESNGEMYLEEGDVEVIRLFVDWLYSSRVAQQDTPEHLLSLFNLYIFAGTICDSNLSNRTMDAIREILYRCEDARTTPELALHIYSQTAEGCPLRKFCIHHLAWSIFLGYDNFSDGTQISIPGDKRLKEFTKQLCKHEDLIVDYFAFIRDNHINLRDPVPFKRQFLMPDSRCEHNFHRHDGHEKERKCYLEEVSNFDDYEQWPEGHRMKGLVGFSSAD